MPVYDSAFIYINTVQGLKDKIIKIDAVIDALYLTAEKAASTDNIEEYSLDDGQTKIKTSYRGANAIFKSIEAFERLKNLYLNKLNGRTFQLRDGRNFRRNGYN